MRRKLWITFVLILLLTVIAGYVNWPGVKRITLGKVIDRSVVLPLGLDLQGGAYIVYEADTSGIASGDVGKAMDGVRSVFDGRVNTLGVMEPEIRSGTTGGKPALFVSLPGFTDIEKAKDLLGKTAKLQFLDQNGTVVLEGKDIIPDKTVAQPSQDSTSGLSSGSNWEVVLDLTNDGKEKFAQATAANIGKQIAIQLDDQIISAPTVQSAITNGSARITGSYTADQAKAFALQLKSGALPVPVKLVQEQTVGATLGSDAIDKSAIAAAIAIVLVMVFMILYYKWCGLLASFALIVYMLLNMMIFRLLPVTMTLAGLAAFILSIGIAVDTNILTFERLKEEQRAGKPMALAIHESFRRSWTSIRDSHVSSLISSVIIFMFASGGIRGFAVILMIGTLLSLFSAITVTRNWMLLIAGNPRLHKLLHP